MSRADDLAAAYESVHPYYWKSPGVARLIVAIPDLLAVVRAAQEVVEAWDRGNAPFVGTLRHSLSAFEAGGKEKAGPPSGYVVPEGDERCGYVMDACRCMKRKGHDGLHACAHGGWRGEAGGKETT